MKLEPFAEVDGIPFSATMADIRQRFGPPQREASTDIGLHELDYGRVVFRFQHGGRLEEVTARAAVVHLSGIAVPFASLAAYVRAHDGDSFRAGGFIVSPCFGLAFDPADSNWVTALAAHCLPQWRLLAGR